MTYINILAGAVGLMVLAACSSVIEQPEALSTITVAYNQSPATRSTVIINTDNPDTPPILYNYAKYGFKVSWESGDQIALIKDGTKYIYETEDEGAVATFTLVSGPAPTAEGDYKVVFPGDWDGNLTDFATQDLMEEFNPYDYLYATGTTTFSNGEFAETVTLTPVFSFLFLDEGVEFHNMQHFFGEGDINDDNYIKYTIYLKGTNLFTSIANFEGANDETKIGIALENCPLFYYGFENRWYTDLPAIIAIPVLGDQSVSNLKLDIDGATCHVSNSTGDNSLTIASGGLIYLTNDEGQNFWFRVQ